MHAHGLQRIISDCGEPLTSALKPPSGLNPCLYMENMNIGSNIHGAHSCCPQGRSFTFGILNEKIHASAGLCTYVCLCGVSCYQIFVSGQGEKPTQAQEEHAAVPRRTSLLLEVSMQ